MYLSIKMNILLLMLLVICKIYTASQLPEPCVGIFKYVSDDNRNYHGEITIKYPPKYESSCLQVTLVYFKLRATVYESGLSLQSKKPIIKNGEPSFVYRIYFDNYYPTTPVIKEIKFNNIVMCHMNYEDPELTRIIMNHCLYPPGVNFTSDAASQDLVEKYPIHRQHFNEVIDVSRTYVVLSENLKAPLSIKQPPENSSLPPANSKPRDPSINSGLTNDLPEYPTIDLSNHVNIGLLDHDNCGKSEENYSSRKKRLTSGTETLIYEFPWMVLIQREYKNTVIQSGHQNFCGGALINENYVLTAAHCVVSKQYTLKVNIGEHDWSKSCDYNCSIENKIFEIEKIRVHPNYQSENICMYDIALIRLKGTVNMKQPNVKPICLPLEPAKHSTYDTKFIATGWGETEDSLSSVYLRKVVLPIVNNKRCSSMPKYENITSRHICAGDGRKKSICHMDSGGPLQAMSHYHNSLRYVLYGIAVCAPPCDDSNGNRPSVFTNVSFYVKWILDTITK